MWKAICFASAVCLLLGASAASATIFGSVQGVVHDPQHRPILNASVTLKAKNSDWMQSQTTNDNGEFNFTSVPIGDYTVTASAKGFQQNQQDVIVESSTSPVLHFELGLVGASETVVVSGTPVQATTDTVTPTTLLSRQDIQQTPGADLTNSTAMITDYVPAAYVTHDMLHMRGGHQFEWLIDGVPVPNTNIAANLGPAIDPKDIDYVEVLRGSYDADYGDRTYGIFNIEPRTGFELNNECELVATFGNYYQTNDQMSCGSHTLRFAYYLSVNGNRSDYGLQTPIPQVIHDAENGYGGFTSLIFNKDPKNQLRLVASLRQDYYQVPVDPDPNSIGNQALAYEGLSPSYGLSDSEREPDGYIVFSWVHTFKSNLLLTVSPFYHYNGADYTPGPDDYPVSSTIKQTANYAGAQTVLDATFWKNDLHVGEYAFFQHQYDYFDNYVDPGYQMMIGMTVPNLPASSVGVNGGVAAEFVDDRFKVTSWLTLIGGLRQTEFRASVAENATDPRAGATVKIPRLNWVFRGFYGDYYQAPPLLTAAGLPFLQELATTQGFSFAPLRGERDKEFQYGVTIPFRGWDWDVDNYQTRATNWLDHNNVGESNLFWPITWSAALIQGWETTLRSPQLWHHAQVHLSYANQIAQATSPITGGLIFSVPPGYAPVDHDQRNTLNVGANTSLPWQSYAAVNVYYGSGFTNGLYGTPYQIYPEPYLPGHTTFDLSLGKTFAEKYTVSVTALNVTNKRVELDNSPDFGGFHWNQPFQIYGEFRWRFHY